LENGKLRSEFVILDLELEKLERVFMELKTESAILERKSVNSL
jgi:hypothetical protein